MSIFRRKQSVSQQSATKIAGSPTICQSHKIGKSRLHAPFECSDMSVCMVGLYWSFREILVWRRSQCC